jgi:hypothetical protein
MVCSPQLQRHSRRCAGSAMPSTSQSEFHCPTAPMPLRIDLLVLVVACGPWAVRALCDIGDRAKRRAVVGGRARSFELCDVTVSFCRTIARGDSVEGALAARPTHRHHAEHECVLLLADVALGTPKAIEGSGAVQRLLPSAADGGFHSTECTGRLRPSGPDLMCVPLASVCMPHPGAHTAVSHASTGLMGSR